jgi:hypothetical protein
MAPSLSRFLSRHAQERMQQRGIGAEAVEQLLAFGSEQHDRHGGVIVYFNRAARARAMRAGGDPRMLDRTSGMYMVIAGGVIATVGHRRRRLRRR